MKRSAIYYCAALVMTTAVSSSVQADTSPASDASTINGLVASLYASVSGPAGQPRDWNRYLSLFQPEARQVAVVKGVDGVQISGFTAQQYADRARQKVPPALFEREARRQTGVHGDIATVVSVYEVREAPAGPVTSLGLYSLQLINDGKRRWIANLLWQGQGDGKELSRPLVQPE